MKIAVTSAGLVLTKAHRGELRHRVLLEMSRFGREVEGVTVRLGESHNPLGGVDQRCRASRLALHVAPALDGRGGRQAAALPARHRGSAG